VLKDVAKAYALSNAKIQFVSLVDKAANKKRFLIAKSEGGNASFQSFGRIVKADGDITGFSIGGTATVSSVDDDLEADEAEKTEKSSLFKKFAKAFGYEVVEKGKVADRYNVRSKGENFYIAFESLAIIYIFYNLCHRKFILGKLKMM
jgi:hypothetical protein